MGWRGKWERVLEGAREGAPSPACLWNVLKLPSPGRALRAYRFVKSGSQPSDAEANYTNMGCPDGWTQHTLTAFPSPEGPGTVQHSHESALRHQDPANMTKGSMAPGGHSSELPEWMAKHQTGRSLPGQLMSTEDKILSTSTPSPFPPERQAQSSRLR